ncbi:hypothetical protein [Brucella anthropi]|uniref:hypothetical protein n=1 Tax=Brucella anthropi TaxID=529 RepID=UPI002360466D|nr:hypothetical protein [Brucella anthropi]
MADRKKFEVTEKAGHFVAGIRNPGANAPIYLTEEQAEYPLMLGEVRRPIVAAEPEASAKGRKG